ncbi:MAG TPA: hypothetical protein VK704_05640 [Acidimicrobiales bacterium]|nr:hypothetical protein [Acidimicrobiales bacterium]
MRSGLAERVRELGLGGAGDSPSENVRSGSLLVLCGWAMFVIAGSGFAKMTEHWVGATPAPDRHLPVGAFGTIQVAAGVGLAIVVIGCVIALPTALRFLREGGWARVRRPVFRGLVVSSTTLLFTAGLVGWVHHRESLSQGGVFGTLAGYAWAILIAASVGFATLAVTEVAGQLKFSPRVLRLEGLLAAALTMTMVVILGAMATWSASIARHAPRVLSGNEGSLVGIPSTPTQTLIALLLLGGLILGVGGTTRVFHSWNRTSRTGGTLLDA